MKKIAAIILLSISLGVNAQSVLVPYRAGKLWGLADTNGLVKVIPQYDSIESKYVRSAALPAGRYSDFHIFQKNGNTGVLKGGRVLLAAKKSHIRIDSVFITEGKIGRNDNLDGVILRNHKGDKLFPDTIEWVDRTFRRENYLYVIEGRKKNAGIFWYDPKEQLIKQWLIRGMEIVRMEEDYKRGLLVAHVFEHVKSPGKTYSVKFNNETKKYDMTPGTGLQSSASTLYASGDKVAKVGSYLKKLEFFEKSPEIYSVHTNGRYSERNPKKDTLEVKLPGDSARVGKYMQFNRVSWHNGPSYKTVDTAYQFVNYITFRKDGKIGALISDTIIPAIYDELIYDPSWSVKPNFIASQRKTAGGSAKWGMINGDHRIVLPLIFDQVIQAGNYRILKGDDGYGLADFDGNMLLPAIYDRIIPSKDHLDFTLIDKGKYGMFSALSKVHCEPIFPYQITDRHWIGDYLVFTLSDKNGRKLGFADPKGTLYFKD